MQLIVHTADERHRPIDAEQEHYPSRNVIAHHQHPTILQAGNQPQ
jgi:hypothetical protein